VRVVELWRYPVKSLQGESLERCRVTADGLEGDRAWALYDPATGYGLTARRIPELLFASARLQADGSVAVLGPDGEPLGSAEDVGEWLGRPVELRAAGDEAAGDRLYENVVDPAREDGAWESFRGASGAFHDSGEVRVSLVSTASLDGWDRRRFRANVVFEGASEDLLFGSRLTLGSAELDVGKRISRCVMVNSAQPGGIESDSGVLREIARERGNLLAVGATVVRPGEIAVGDELMPVSGRRAGPL
jgi:uncharacterized protein YcbX